MDQEYISLEGIRQNNLKNLNIRIPLNKMTVITGVSGSGKSSLAFDTIYAEGQRRYVETFSSYARQFLDRMDRPQIDKIEGIPPSIAIDQTNPVRTSRSTVGTMTEINDHLKLMFARASFLVCSKCKKPVLCDNAESIYKQLQLKKNELHLIVITFEVRIPSNFSKNEIHNHLSSQGYTRFLKENSNSIIVIQDRVETGNKNRSRIIEDIEVALKYGQGKIEIYPEINGTYSKPLRFSSGLHCPDCNIQYKDPSPGLFSFNSPVGACENCKGFGRVIGIDYNLVMPDHSRSLKDGLIKPFQTSNYHECQEDLIRFALKRNIPIDVPWIKMSGEHKKWVIEGEGEWDDNVWYGVDRFFEWLNSKSYKMHIRVLLSRYRTYHLCSSCNGARLKPQALLWYLGNKKVLNIHDIMQLPVKDCLQFFEELRQSEKFDEAAQMVVHEICIRLKYLVEVGLGYLTLDRQSRTLSGGEVQRINLTTALGTSLVNTLFILDEPSIGLHSRDIRKLISILHRLRNSGNTLIIVEHDPEVIKSADYIIDLGPGPGEKGGEIVFCGPMDKLKLSKRSKTAAYLFDSNKKHFHKQKVLSPEPDYVCLKGASEHNLKNIDVNIPLNRLVCITGVSGSGKSTLMEDICYYGIKTLMGKSVQTPGSFESIDGIERISDVVFVDQSSIGKTTRSNPVSYIGAFEPVRKLFADQPLSRKRFYSPGTFSFNSGDGRCPACNGNGFEHVEMQFLSDVYLRCPDCDGKRYREEILEVKIDSDEGSKSIYDVLNMTVDEACKFFKDAKKIVSKLDILKTVGLSYLRLGQPLSTLSGGEAQRLKLASHLSGNMVDNGKGILFLFDEPTTGLHFADINVLINALRTLVDSGHSVVVIEHNLDVINASDWIIDLGPQGGKEGGEVVFCGPPSGVIKCKKSYTGAALLDYRKASFPLPATKVQDTFSQFYSDIVIRKAREHNLQNIDLSIPRDKFTVITGVSGSGKSTVAFDILFAEGQRRYLESLNAYARQFIQPASRPDVDSVCGIPPAVAIEQRTSRGGRKSTVATVTEIYHFLRLLYVKLGLQYCPSCNVAIQSQSSQQILAEIMSEYKGKTVSFYAPLVSNRKGYYTDLAIWAAAKGYKYLRVDNELLQTEAWPRLDRFKEHTIEIPFGDVKVSADEENALDSKIQTALQYGKGIFKIDVKGWKRNPGKIYSTLHACPVCHKSFSELDPKLFSFNSRRGWCENCFGTGLELNGFDEEQSGEEIWWNEWFDGTDRVCRRCGGKRLNETALAVRFKNRNISEFAELTVAQAYMEINKWELGAREEAIGKGLVEELKSRLEFLKQVGLDYLTLDRAAPTLSGGEAQRIRLAAQLGSNLRGVCYILDEPTIGLHSRDNLMLLDTLFSLKAKGNTVVVVEHDQETIQQAEYIVDLGPGGGKNGGKLLAHGKLEDLKKNRKSITGKYISNPPRHSRKRRKINNEKILSINSANLHNLKNIDVDIPLGMFVCVTGVSGSGKSTLVRDILYSNLSNEKNGRENKKYTGCKSISGTENVSRVREVDQRPIGKTPRSCPATYIGFMDDIRKLFAKSPEAIVRGYTASRFSFNVNEGRCKACNGQGIKKIEMSFLPDVSVLCEECNGKRFTRETLAVKFKEKTIADVLAMDVDEAVAYFAAHPSIHKPLELLKDVGLGYLTLGQQSPTLSGGEAQRIKLVTELAKSGQKGRSMRIRKNEQQQTTLYILDEPTVGLHMADVDLLLKAIHRLVDSGNTVVVIEHNLDVIAEADWIIDLGPEGGDGGGKIVTQGTPEQILKVKKSYTAKYLKPVLKTNRVKI